MSMDRWLWRAGMGRSATIVLDATCVWPAGGVRVAPPSTGGAPPFVAVVVAVWDTLRVRS